MEIPTFGLLPELVGHEYGGHALTLAVRRAWNTVGHDDLAPPRHVWLHTSRWATRTPWQLPRPGASVPIWERRNGRELPMSLSGPAGLDDDCTSRTARTE